MDEGKRKSFKDAVISKFQTGQSDGKRDTLYQFIKFGLVGLSNTLLSYIIYLLVLWVLHPYDLSWDYYAANVMSFLLSVLWSFALNNKLVFHGPKEKKAVLKSLLKTYLMYLFTGVILANILLYIWVARLGINKVIAPLINLVINVPLNFILSKYWAFRKPKEEPQEQDQ
ncbi:MAG: GtrA family protein [Clostridiales bacterium]|nr:GtrA family protein [Clostridiales bacterium]